MRLNYTISRILAIRFPSRIACRRVRQDRRVRFKILTSSLYVTNVSFKPRTKAEDSPFSCVCITGTAGNARSPSPAHRTLHM
ncbi:hypothetical protein PUN28_003864 [Cardiocondyla obscurior]|uniref:Uncharacterized protein n=1 Tax=Cardiocondyla obscurior TaxID=286306 RepID=A0AAW2GNW4_9HYME